MILGPPPALTAMQDEEAAMEGTRPKPAGEDKLDETVEDTFPASDPPPNTPVEGSRKAERDRATTERAK